MEFPVRACASHAAPWLMLFLGSGEFDAQIPLVSLQQVAPWCILMGHHL